jgi:hypothetical protein
MEDTSNLYSVLSRTKNTVTSASPRTFYITILILVIVIGVFVYMWFKPKARDVTVMGPIVLKGDTGVPQPNSIQSIFDNTQLVSSMGNNFTLSFFVYMDDVNRERIPIAGPKGDYRFKPFLYILGVGDVLLDPIHQIARVRIRPLRRDASPDTITSIDIDNFMIARWNQLTISIEGRSVDVYLNGALVKSTLLSNLPILTPVGVLLETSPDFSGQAGLLQAWPYRQKEAQVMENYKRNVDVRGKPLIPDKQFGWSDIVNTLGKQLCNWGFCGFSITNGPLDYIEYEFA